MRRFAGFLCAALMFAVMLSGASRVDGRDDPKEKKYDCAICDDAAYAPSKNRAVVFIHAAGVNRGEHRTPHFAAQHGSGFVFTRGKDTSPLICTEYHVIDEAVENRVNFFVVYLADMKESVLARIVVCDRANDLAIIEFAEDGYVYRGEALELGDDADVAKGDVFTAIGAPSGHGFMETSGKFRKRYEVKNDATYLLHDAKTTGGCSGGPVLDADGKVVGVNSAILMKEDKEYPGNLATPVSALKALLEYVK